MSVDIDKVLHRAKNVVELPGYFTSKTECLRDAITAIEQLQAENKTLRRDLEVNANMLAKQCDRAMALETENERLRKLIADETLRNVDEALKGGE